MKKKDLKTGMILEFNGGKTGMVLLGTNRGDIFSGGAWGMLEDFNEDLENEYCKNHIIKVYQPKHNVDFLNNGISLNNTDLLWEKPNKVHMLRKRLLKKQEVNKEMFAELTPEETMELAKLLTYDYNIAIYHNITGKGIIQDVR